MTSLNIKPLYRTLHVLYFALFETEIKHSSLQKKNHEWKPCQVNIQLGDTGNFWALDKNNVVLRRKGLNLTTVPFGPTPGFVKGSSINRFHGESIKSNGYDEQLTLSSTIHDLTQCWHFSSGGIIRPCDDLLQAWAVTAVPAPGFIYTVKLKRIGSVPGEFQTWVINKVK
ncbi:unnamed protein product [Rhizophagus irregularis]|nr:unnamed protein product [Rhizophagus irregularis]